MHVVVYLVKTSLRFSALRNDFDVLTRGLDLVELTSRNAYCEDTGKGQEWQFFWKLLYVVRSSAHMAYVKAG